MEKFINYTLVNGEKRQSQNRFLKMVKNLQKGSDTNFTHLLKLSFVFLASFFKVNNCLTTNKHKRVTFLVLHQDKSRFFLAIKSLVQTIKKGESAGFFKKLYKEIKCVLEKKSSITQTKKVLQNKVLSKRHLFFYFR
jgi:ribosomal protein S7